MLNIDKTLNHGSYNNLYIKKINLYEIGMLTVNFKGIYPCKFNCQRYKNINLQIYNCATTKYKNFEQSKLFRKED